MFKLKLFLLSFVLATGTVLAVIYVQRPKEAAVPDPILVRIADDLFLTSQLKPENIRALRRRGINTIVDIRPDGEAADQAPSSEIELASRENGLDFHCGTTSRNAFPIETALSR